jgi:hypothetical protein
LSSGQPSNKVTLTFLSNGSAWGARTEPGDAGFGLAGSSPFLQVKVVDRVQMFFLALLNHGTTDVPAIAGCGLQLANAPVPLVVLDPTSSGSLSGGGNPTISILGGPPQSIQVNSGNQNAIANGLGKTNSFGGSINLTQGGPAYNGSSLGVSGGPYTAPASFSTNNSGTWMAPSAPISDPFSTLPEPSKPGAPTTPSDLTGNPNCTPTKIQQGSCQIAYGNAAHGCPLVGGNCTLYSAGDYPNGIKVKGSEVAIFDPGVYYLEKSFWLDSNSFARTSTVATGDGTSGTMFYLTGTATGGNCKDLLCVDANSGKPSGGVTLDTYSMVAAQCPASLGGQPLDPNLISTLVSDGLNYTTLNGNFLLGQCSGTYDPAPGYRGMVFFADRSKAVNGSWSGGGQNTMAGNAYFHHSGSFDSSFTLQGSGCSASYVLGEIVTDDLAMGGTPCIKMVLNPSSTFNILKAALLH